MKIIYIIYTGIIAALIFILSFVCVSVSWWLLFLPKEKRYRIADYLYIIPWTFIVNNMIFFMRLKILGKENVDRKRTTLYICNHQSWVDIPTFLRYSHATGVSKKEVQRILLIGLLTKFAGAIFFDRDDKAARLALVKELIHHFKSGFSLCVFPEGTRSRDGNLIEPNLAIIKLCYKLKVPVVSSAIEGTREILPRGAKVLKFFKRVVIKYNPPIYPEDFDNDDDFANACWQKVIDSHKEIVDSYFTCA